MQRMLSGVVSVLVRTSRRRHVHVRVADEKCVVDYAGLTMPVVEVQTGDGRDGQFFVGALGASHVIYSEAHVRSALKGRYTTEPTHRPKAHTRHLEGTPSRLIAWGARIGIPSKAIARASASSRCSGATRPRA